MKDLDDFISNALVTLACVVILVALSGCFIANAKQRSHDREVASTNLPPMEVTTNLFRPTIPDFR